MVFFAIIRQFVSNNSFSPDLPFQCQHQLCRISVNHYLSAIKHGHVGAEIVNVCDNMSREDHNDILADFAEQIEKPVALLGIQSGCRLIHYDDPWIAKQCLSNAKSLAHPSRKSVYMLPPVLV